MQRLESLPEYQKLAFRTAKSLEFEQAIDHAILGMGSDWGEVVTCVKSLSIYGAPFKRGDKVYVNMREELGDVAWFIAYTLTILHEELVKCDGIAVWIPYESHQISRQMVEVAKRGLRNCGEIISASNGAKQNDKLLFISYVGLLWSNFREMCLLSGFDMFEILTENIEKLQKRFPDAYTDEDALARADKNYSA